MSSNMFPDADIASLTIGLFEYKGAYNAATNTPDLDSTPITIAKGDSYNVSAAGLFFTEYVSIGDVMTATVDNPTTLAQWVIVQDNIEEEEITPVVATTYTIESKDSVIEVRTDEIFGVTGSRASAASVGSATTRASMPFVPSRPAASSIGSTAAVVSGATVASTPSTASAGSSVAVASNASVASSPNTASAGSVAAVSSQAALAAQPVSITLRDGQRPVDIDVVGTSASYVELLPISGSTIDGKNKFVFHGTAGEESARAYQYGGTHDVDFGVMMSPDANTGGTVQDATTGAVKPAEETGSGTSAVVGNARGQDSVDLQMYRANATQVNAGSRSFMGSGHSNTIAAGVVQAGIPWGYDNNISGGGYCSLAGNTNSLNGYNSTGVGLNISITGDSSHAVGSTHTVTHDFCHVTGERVTTIIDGEVTHGSYSSSSTLKSAVRKISLKAAHTDGAATELLSRSTAGERITPNTNYVSNIKARITVGDASSANYFVWEIDTTVVEKSGLSFLTSPDPVPIVTGTGEYSVALTINGADIEVKVSAASGEDSTCDIVMNENQLN